MFNSIYIEKSRRKSANILLLGLFLILFGTIIIVAPEILFFMIATPIIFTGIFLVTKWFKTHRNRNDHTWVDI